MTQTIDELKAEQSTLQAAIAALETERAAIDGRLDALLAQAERGGAGGDIIAAREAESAVATLGTELRRKRAALVACEADLATATAERAAGERAKVKGDLIAMFAVYEELVYAIGEDIGDPVLWTRLAKTVDEANALYLARIYKGGEGLPVRLLTRPVDVRGRIFAALGARIDSKMGLHNGADGSLTPAVAFDLDLLRKRVAHL